MPRRTAEPLIGVASRRGCPMTPKIGDAWERFARCRLDAVARAWSRSRVSPLAHAGGGVAFAGRWRGSGALREET